MKMKNQGNLVPSKDYSSLMVTAPQNMKICDLPNLIKNLGFIGGSDGNESACNEGDLDLIPGWEDPLEEGMATHSSIFT